MTLAPKIAIIGAGMAGLRIAQRLRDVARIEVFEKSRGLGGRMSTRRADPYQFDHGAQYFTAHGAGFREFLRPYENAGVVQKWAPRLTRLNTTDPEPLIWQAPRYVAAPGMTALCKAMAEDVRIHRATRVKSLSRNNGQWSISCEDGSAHQGYDWVLSTAPSVQTQALLPQLAGEGFEWPLVAMRGCYSLMLGFDTLPELGWDAALVMDSPLAWIAHDRSKPGRPGAGSVLCQSDNLWADAHMEDDQAEVQRHLCEVFQDVTGIDWHRASYVSLHRWRYAKVAEPAPLPCLLRPDVMIGAAGDWFGGGRVEAAFDSAEALCQQMRALL